MRRVVVSLGLFLRDLMFKGSWKDLMDTVPLCEFDSNIEVELPEGDRLDNWLCTYSYHTLLNKLLNANTQN